MPKSEKLSQYRYWLMFLILVKFMILYFKDSLGCIDNNKIELINNKSYCTESIESTDRQR